MQVSNFILSRIKEYLRLMRLDKPIGIMLLLWPTLIGLWFAGNGNPPLTVVVIFVLGVVVMRSAGCVINDIWDRNIDRNVARTMARPLAAKTITVIEALIIFFILLTAALFLVLQLNIQAILLAIASLGLVVVYPLMKRYTGYPQVVLGLAFAWPILMAQAAINPVLDVNSNVITTGMLYAAMICWIIAYDTEYALVDKADDLLIGVKSTAITFGSRVYSVILTLHIASVAILAWLGVIHRYASTFFIALAIALLMVFHQQWLLRSNQSNQSEQYFKAFQYNNYLGMIFFIGFYFA